MSRRAAAHRGLAHLSRLRVLDAIHTTPGIALGEVAERTGLHTNTVRDHVSVLLSEGFVVTESERRGTRGRPRVLLHPVSTDRGNDTAERRIDAAKRHGDILRRVAPETRPAHLDDDAAHQLDALYEHFDDVGLEPDVDEAHMQVGLVPCPFHELVDGNLEVACRVHTTLVESVLQQAGGPVELDRIEPFATPHRCVVHLQLRQAPAQRDD